MKRAIILAAGKGERLVNGLTFPKPLKRVAGVPLIVRACLDIFRQQRFRAGRTPPRHRDHQPYLCSNPSTEANVLRPFVPQSRHNAEGRLW